MVPIGELSEYAKSGLPTAVKGIDLVANFSGKVEKPRRLARFIDSQQLCISLVHMRGKLRLNVDVPLSWTGFRMLRRW